MRYWVALVIGVIIIAAGGYVYVSTLKRTTLPPVVPVATSTTETRSSIKQGDTRKLVDFYTLKQGKLYYQDKLVTGDAFDADSLAPASTLLTGGARFLKDKEHVYLVSLELAVVPGADPATFELLGCSDSSDTCYARDKNTIYYENYPVVTPVAGADRTTFKLTPEFSKYNDTWEMQVPYYDAQDAEHTYALGKRIVDVKDTSLQSVGGGYFKDTKNVYAHVLIGCRQKVCQGPLVVLDQYDASTFAFMDECWSNEPGDRAPDTWYYVKDSKAVYCNDIPLKDADPSTFEVLGRVEDPGTEWVTFAGDRNHVFQAGEMLKGVDPKTFVVPKQIESRG